MSFIKIAEDFDRQQAFAAGFAMASRDAGLSDDEYQTMCKIAADQLGIPAAAPPPPAATGVTPPAVANSVVPIQTPAQANEVKRMDFVSQKAQQVQGGQPMPKQAQESAPAARAEMWAVDPVATNKGSHPALSTAAPVQPTSAYDPYTQGSGQLDYWKMAPAAPAVKYDPYGKDQLNYENMPASAPVAVAPAVKPVAVPVKPKQPSPGSIAPGVAEFLKNFK